MNAIELRRPFPEPRGRQALPLFTLRFGNLLLACTIALSTCACVLALGPQGHISGAELPLEVPHLQPQATPEQIVSLLGPPSTRQVAADTEHLSWTEVLRPRECRTYLFAVIPLTPE